MIYVFFKWIIGIGFKCFSSVANFHLALNVRMIGVVFDESTVTGVGFGAVFASVGLFASVRIHVTLESCGPLETPQADVTLIIGLSGVNDPMADEIAGFPEAHATILANVWPEVKVEPLVDDNLALASESLEADVTFEALLARVTDTVVLQGGFIPELFIADFTLEAIVLLAGSRFLPTGLINAIMLDHLIGRFMGEGASSATEQRISYSPMDFLHMNLQGVQTLVALEANVTFEAACMFLNDYFRGICCTFFALYTPSLSSFLASTLRSRLVLFRRPILISWHSLASSTQQMNPQLFGLQESHSAVLAGEDFANL